MIKGSLFILLFFLARGLTAASFTVDFSAAPPVQYNRTNTEIYGGKLRLSPRGWFWTNLPGTLNMYSAPSYLFEDKSGNLYAGATEFGSGGSGYRSTNRGMTWTNFFQIINRMLEASDGNLYCVGGNCCGASVWKSYDQGKTWSDIIPGGAAGSYCIFEDSQRALYLHLSRYQSFPVSWSSNHLYKSFDFGTNWTCLYREGTGGPTPLGYTSWLHELANGNLITGGSHDLCVSSNRGTNWSVLSDSSNYRTGIFRSGNGNLYVYGKELAVLSEEGTAWTPLPSIIGGRLFEADDLSFYKTDVTNTLYRSYDGGLSWILLPPLSTGGASVIGYYLPAIQASDRRIYVLAATNDIGGGLTFRSGYGGPAEAELTVRPEGRVFRWRDFTRTESLNGGTVSYEFAASRDGGATFGSWQALNRANLEALTCASNGQDLLRVRITLSALDHESTPEVSSLTVLYDAPAAYGDLSGVVLAPNPVKPGPGQTLVFYNLTPEFEIKVLTVGGKEAAFLKGSSTGGKWAWDCRKKNGRFLAPGVYILRFTASGSAEQYRKLVIR